jgi:hypothetical protein
MPNLRILAVMFLPLALSVRAAPLQQQPELPQAQQAPVRPCLVDSTSSCLSLAPQPFRPCLAETQSCGDHVNITPVSNPVWMPVSAAGQKAPR